MIQPLHDNIAVRPDPFVQSGLLILPEEDMRTGVVIAVGPGKKDSKRPLMAIMSCTAAQLIASTKI